MNGNNVDCEQQIAQLSQTVRTLLLSLNDVISNKVKPLETRVVQLEAEVESLKEDIKKMRDDVKSNHKKEEPVETETKAVKEESENLTKVEGKINLLEKRIKTLEVKPTERNQTAHEIRNVTEQTDRQFQCTYCTRKFMSEHALWRHMDTSHPQMEPKLFKCKYCVTLFHSRESLWMHTVNEHIDIIAPYNYSQVATQSHQ